MITHHLLHTLLEAQEPPCVSVYLPLQAGAAHAGDNAKRLLAALDEVEASLSMTGLSSRGQKQFLATARNFAEQECTQLIDGGTVALFLTPSSFHHVVLLKSDEECITVGRRFHVSPLLPYLTEVLRYHLLTVSKKHVHLYAVDGDRCEEQRVEEMPVSMDDVREGMEREKGGLQTHSTGSGTSGIHGQGGASDIREMEEDAFMQRIAHSAQTLVRQDDRPLVFAGVTELFGMFRSFDKSNRLLDRYVAGSPDADSLDEVKRKADLLVMEQNGSRAQRLLEEYGSLTGTGRTSTDIAAILEAAFRGKVDLLLAAKGAQLWGTWNEEENTVVVLDGRNGDREELIGLAAAHALEHRGRFFLLDAAEMPEQATIAAILRY